jgi:hypothetical protein
MKEKAMKKVNRVQIEGRRRELDQEAVRVKSQIRQLAVKRSVLVLSGWAVGLGLMGLRMKVAWSKQDVRWLPVMRISRSESRSFHGTSEFQGFGWQTAS